MILVDFNQVMISNMMFQLGNHTNIPLEEGLFRHMVLNSIRTYKQQFGNKYGEIVIACDDRNYWRKQLFPYYKANRKKNRDQSEINWNLVFEIFNKIRVEIKEYFPYRVVIVDSVEADDIIATLTVENKDDNILILSSDKDFIQLQKNKNVKQFDPIRKKWIKHDDPERYLFEHILKGDAGDGIPNILSDDDTFVSVGKRQKPMTQKKIDLMYDNRNDVLELEMHVRFMRNKQLVDLSMIPTYVKDQIISKYNDEANKDRSKIFNYFIKYKLKHLMENVGEF
jgi:hypothetical protein